MKNNIPNIEKDALNIPYFQCIIDYLSSRLSLFVLRYLATLNFQIYPVGYSFLAYLKRSTTLTILAILKVDIFAEENLQNLVWQFTTLFTEIYFRKKMKSMLYLQKSSIIKDLSKWTRFSKLFFRKIQCFGVMNGNSKLQKFLFLNIFS